MRMKPQFLLAVAALASVQAISPLGAAEKVDFHRQIRPILEANCVRCHGPEKPKGHLRLDTRAGALKGGDNGAALVPGQPGQSPLYTSTILPVGDDNKMPPKGESLIREQS